MKGLVRSSEFYFGDPRLRRYPVIFKADRYYRNNLIEKTSVLISIDDFLKVLIAEVKEDFNL